MLNKDTKPTNWIMRLAKKLDSIQFGLDEEKEFFVENLSMLLAAGINVSQALESIKHGMKNEYMKNLMDEIKHDIEGGSPMWKAFAKHDLLPGHVIALFRIGEESGRLPENLKMINEQQQKERVFKGKIRSAMMYPVLVLVLTMVIGVGIAWFILPRLSGVFASLKLELPAITKVLIKVGNFLGEHGLIVIPIFVICFLTLLYFVFVFKKTKFIGQAFLMKIPGISDLIQQTELSRFGFVMGQLLDASLPVMDALESLHSSTTVLRYQELYMHLKERIRIGESFETSFNSFPNIDPLVPGPIRQMIASGEQAGQLPQLLQKIGEVFEEKADSTTKNLSVILEPLLLVVVWGGVVSVALAVILPIYSLIGGVGKGPTAATAPKPAQTQSVKKTIKNKPVTRPTKKALPASEVGSTKGGEKKPLLIQDDEFEFVPVAIPETNNENQSVIVNSYQDLDSQLDEAEVQTSNMELPSTEGQAETFDRVSEPKASNDDTGKETTVSSGLSESSEKGEVATTEGAEEESEKSGLLSTIIDKIGLGDTDESEEGAESVVEEKSKDESTQEEESPKTEGLLSRTIKRITPGTETTAPKVEEVIREVVDEEGIEESTEIEVVVTPEVSSEAPRTTESSRFIRVVRGISYLNVREYPTTSSKVLKKIYPGEVYEVVRYWNGWYKIQLSSVEAGWAHGGYVRGGGRRQLTITNKQ